MSLRRGFSLVELLVVTGILGLLISMLLPALTKARQQALKVACASNMKQIWLAINAYANEWRGATPPLCYDDTDTLDPKDPSLTWPKYTFGFAPVDNCGGSGYRGWPQILWRYQKSSKVCVCPNAYYPQVGWTYELNPNFCPSWIYSGGLYTGGAGPGNAGPAGNPLVPIGYAWTYSQIQNIRFRMGSFQYTQDKILLTESNQGLGPYTPALFRDRYWVGEFVNGSIATNGVFITYTNGAGIDANHNGYANCLMLDGSVQSFSGKKAVPLNEVNYPISGPTTYSWWRPDAPSYHP